MNHVFVTFRSVTFAQRGERILQGAGIGCSLQRTPRWMEEQGCGYCLKMKETDAARAVQNLRGNGVPLRRIYGQKSGGVLEELAL